MKPKQFFKQNRTFILYGLFGFITTLINYAAYILCRGFSQSTAFCVIIAWLISVICAYIFSKTIVFKSKNTSSNANIPKEFVSFLLCRVTSAGIELIIMLVFADKMGYNHYVVKLAACCIVTVINFVISKRIFLTTGRKR